MRRLKELEDENRRLKRMYADLSIQTKNVKDALQKRGDNHNREALGTEMDLSLPTERVIHVPWIKSLNGGENRGNQDDNDSAYIS